MAKLAADAVVVLVLGAIGPSTVAGSPRPDAAPPAMQVVLTTPASQLAPAGASAAERGTTAVSVNVGGGPLLVLGDQPHLTFLETAPGRSVAHVDGVRVVDARGTDEGWRLLARVSTRRGGTVRVHVDRIEAFAESTAGLTGGEATLRDGATGTIAAAAAGNSGGAFDLTITVTWEQGNDNSPPSDRGPADGLLLLTAA